jgi:hypothetical protein
LRDRRPALDEPGRTAHVLAHVRFYSLFSGSFASSVARTPTDGEAPAVTPRRERAAHAGEWLA